MTAVLNNVSRKIELDKAKVYFAFRMLAYKVKIVSFDKLANAFDAHARSDYSLGRIHGSLPIMKCTEI